MKIKIIKRIAAKHFLVRFDLLEIFRTRNSSCVNSRDITPALHICGGGGVPSGPLVMSGRGATSFHVWYAQVVSPGHVEGTP